MRIENSKLGDVEFENDRVITLSDGLPGFSDARRFVLLDLKEGSVFKWLLSVDRPEIAFVVTDPYVFFPSYQTRLSEEDLASVGFRESDDLSALAVVSIRGRRKGDTTLNLRAPVVVNLRTLLGKQVVMKDESWGIQVPLPAIAPSPSGGKDRRAAASK